MNKGILYGIAAYGMWGLFPIYFKALQDVPAFQILGHRIVWSFLFVTIILASRGELAALRKALTGRILLVYLAAGVLLAANWGIYVWAVNEGHLVESSLGYFITPIVNVVLGMVFLKERLRPLQWLPVGLATVAVTFLTVSFGSLPWIALALAFTFGLYGLIKKLSSLAPLPGLSLETAFVFLPAIVFLLYEEATGVGTFPHGSLFQTGLLIFSGVVTAVPLLLFARGAKVVPLSTLGLLQYISPTFQFLLGTLVYGEPFNPQKLVGFGIIWVALIIYSAESYVAYRRSRLAQAAA